MRAAIRSTSPTVLVRIDPQAEVVPHLVESLGGQPLEKRFLALQILSELGRRVPPRPPRGG